MKIGDAEYKKLLEQYIKEQRDSAVVKPVGMMGNWAFHSMKSKEFEAKMIREGRVENIQSLNKPS